MSSGWIEGMDDRPRPLGGVERTHQCQTARLLRVEQRQSGQRTTMDAPRLGSHEGRCHHDPPVEDHRVDAQVVTVDLPAPGFVPAGPAEDRHEVRPLTERLVVARDLGQQLVDAHDRARLMKAARRERRPQDVERQLADRGREVLEHQPVPEVIHVDVDPRPPLGGVHGERHSCALVRCERVEECQRRFRDRLRADARRTVERSQPVAPDAVVGDAQQRTLELGGPLVDDVEHLWWGVVDMHTRRHRRQRADAEPPPPVGRLFLLGAQRRTDRPRHHGLVRFRRSQVGDARRALDPAGGVRDHGAVRVEARPAPGIAEHSTRLGDDQARCGEVPQRSERQDRGIELTDRGRHGVEHDALTAWRFRLREPVGQLVAPPEEEPGPRHDDHRRRLERRSPSNSGRHRRVAIEHAIRPERRLPGTATAGRPAAATVLRARHESDDDLVADLERDRRAPPGSPEGVVVGAIDAIEDPSPAGGAGVRPDLLADHGIVGVLGPHDSEHRLLHVEVDLRDRRAVDLVRGQHLLRPETPQGGAVGGVGEPEREIQIPAPVVHRASLALGATDARVAATLWCRARSQPRDQVA